MRSTRSWQRCGPGRRAPFQCLRRSQSFHALIESRSSVFQSPIEAKMYSSQNLVLDDSQLITERCKSVSEENIFVAATALAQKCRSVNLGQGFPSFQTPDFVKNGVIRAMHEDHNQYTRPAGHPLLVQTLSEFYSPLFGRNIDPMSEISVSAGAQGAIFNIFAAFVEAGDEIVCIEPYFEFYRRISNFFGIRTTGVPLRPDFDENGNQRASQWKLDIDELEKKITEKTRLLVFNTPHNPVGKVFSRDELESLATMIRKFPNLLVLSDEVYEFMCFEGIKHERLATLEGMFDRTISVYSAGKTFSCTGWRIGYCIGPKHLIEPLANTQGVNSFCAATNNQVATSYALRECMASGYLDELPKMLERKRDVLAGALSDCGLKPVVSQAGYFLLADTSKLPVEVESGEKRDSAVNKWLSTEVGITGMPISYFYSKQNEVLGNNFLRFAYCKTDEELEEACRRLKKLKCKLG